MKQIHQYKILFGGYPKCNTYWCNLLETNHVSYQELARALGKNDYVIYKYCAGRDIPPRKIVSEICKYFKVDFLSGLQEFVKAHSNYIEQSNRKDCYTYDAAYNYLNNILKITEDNTNETN